MTDIINKKLLNEIQQLKLAINNQKRDLDNLQDKIVNLLNEHNRNAKYEDRQYYCSECNKIGKGRCWGCYESDRS